MQMVAATWAVIALLGSGLVAVLIDSRTSRRSIVADIRTEIRQVDTGLRTDMAQLRTEFRTEFRQVDSGLRHDMAQLRTELRTEMAQLGTSVDARFDEVAGQFHDFQQQLQAMAGDIHRIDGVMAVVAQQSHTHTTAA